MLYYTKPKDCYPLSRSCVVVTKTQLAGRLYIRTCSCLVYGWKLWKCDGEEGGNREKGRENGRFVEEERREVEKLSIGRLDVDVEAKT